MFIIITRKNIVCFILILLFVFAIAVIIHAYQTSPAFSDLDWSNHFAPFKPRTKGHSVLVDLDNRTLALYEDALVIRSWPVSGGSKETPSPTGGWVAAGIENWGEGFGGSWIALNVPWGKYGIHGTVEPWACGNHNISHGCIRMKDEDVAELKKYLSTGDPIYIKHDDAPFRVLKDGKVGSDVLKLQLMLQDLGYYGGSPDGEFGGKTFKAVCAFQKNEQLTVDGEIGQHGWNILLERVQNKTKRV